MDDFFSKYGWLIVAGIIVIAMVTLAPTVADRMGTSITNSITSLENALNPGDAGE